MLKKLKNIFQSRFSKIVAIIIALAVIAVIFRLVTGQGGNEEIVPEPKTVEVSRVGDLSSGNTPLSISGTVISQSEAMIRTESQGEITNIYKKLGDSVFAGQTIAEIKNTSQRAEVLRAQGVLQAAEANLAKVSNSSGQSLVLLKNSIKSSYNTSDDVVGIKIDQLFRDTDTNTPEMKYNFDNYSYKIQIENKRIDLVRIMKDWKVAIESLDNLSTLDEIKPIYELSRTNLGIIQDLIDDVAYATSQLQSSDALSQPTIDKYRSDISVGRSSIDGTLSSLVTNYNTLVSQIGSNGSKGEDILAAEASVTQAKAGLLSAQASLSKTIISSPITGKLNFINITKGDFVNASQEVAQVVGTGEIEISAFITESERENIKIGSRVLIDKKWQGSIERIAPSVNPNTQKIEIRIVPETDAKLTDGSFVSVEILRDISVLDLDNDNLSIQTISLPISSVKIEADGNFVFKVDSENKLEKISVVLGEVIGNKVIIEEGVSPDEIIVVDARGLKEGQEVTVSE